MLASQVQAVGDWAVSWLVDTWEFQTAFSPVILFMWEDYMCLHGVEWMYKKIHTGSVLDCWGHRRCSEQRLAPEELSEKELNCLCWTNVVLWMSPNETILLVVCNGRVCFPLSFPSTWYQGFFSEPLCWKSGASPWAKLGDISLSMFWGHQFPRASKPHLMLQISHVLLLVWVPKCFEILSVHMSIPVCLWAEPVPVHLAGDLE